MLVKELGKMWKTRRCLITECASSDVESGRARRRIGHVSYEQVAGPSASSTGIGCNFSDLKCRHWTFEAKRSVNQRVIDVGLVSEWESVRKDVNALEVGFWQSSMETTLATRVNCEAGGSVQDENVFHCCETLRLVQDATQRHGCWQTDRADVEDGLPLELAGVALLRLC